MAERRMFAKTIIDSDAFLDMPLSAQALYFHLSMRADDEGFLGNPKRIRSMIGASEDDYKLLIVKRFILVFPSGITVIRHWRIHNLIQKDRFKETTYIEEKSMLALDGKKAYTERVETECIQVGNNLDTQYSIGKDSIDKESIDKEKEERKEERKEREEDDDIYAGARENKHLSHDEVMTEMGVSDDVRRALKDFLRHCYLNHCLKTNDELCNIIVRLDTNYGNNELAKCDSLRRAISGGYLDIAEKLK